MVNILFYVRLRDYEKDFVIRRLGNLANVYFFDDIKEKEDILRDVDILVTGSGRELDNELLKNLKSLKFIQLLAAGADKVPFDKIGEDVIVANNAGGNSIAVAEHTIGLLLSLLKNICYHDSNMRKGLWDRKKYGSLIYGKKVCILGYGNIGCELAKRLKSFGSIIIGINRSGKNICSADYTDSILKIKDMDKVIGTCDIVIITLPLNKSTRGMINLNFLSKLKKDGILINVGRGEVINQKDLYLFLKDNPEFRAGIDVWWSYPEEPYAENFYQKYPFHELDNIIMTPHIAGFSKEIRKKVIEGAIENVIRFIEGKPLKNIVSRYDYL